MAGDYILSLNEQSGKFEYQTVEKTHNKGVQDSFALITEQNLQIETTAEHPYLVLSESRRKIKQTSTTFEVDQSGRIEEFNKDSLFPLPTTEVRSRSNYP